MEEIGSTGYEWLYPILLVIGIAFALAIVLLVWVIGRVGRINIPENADFFTTLRATPFVVVLLLDLLDLSLDVLAAPITWILLSKLGLKPLRMVTAVEGLIPGTQFVPLLTIAWFVARLSSRRQ